MPRKFHLRKRVVQCIRFSFGEFRHTINLKDILISRYYYYYYYYYYLLKICIYFTNCTNCINCIKYINILVRKILSL